MEKYIEIILLIIQIIRKRFQMLKNNTNIVILIWLIALTGLILYLGFSNSHQSNLNQKFGTYTPTTIVTMDDSLVTLYKIRPKYDSLRTFIGSDSIPFDSTYSRAYLIPWGDSSTAGVFAPIAYGPVVIDSFNPTKTLDTLVLKGRVPVGSWWMITILDSVGSSVVKPHAMKATIVDTLRWPRVDVDTILWKRYATWRIK